MQRTARNISFRLFIAIPAQRKAAKTTEEGKQAREVPAIKKVQSPEWFVFTAFTDALRRFGRSVAPTRNGFSDPVLAAGTLAGELGGGNNCGS